MSEFEPKKMDMINKATAKLIDAFAVKGKVRLIGSNALRSTKYGSDYDVEAVLKSPSVPKIAELIRDQYLKAVNNPNIWITDFKCGHDPRLVYKGDYSTESLKKYLDNPLIPPQRRKEILDSTGEKRIELVRDLFILRWKPQDIRNGYICLIDGTKRTLEECLTDKTTTKIDLIQKVGVQFAEISENYYIKVGNQSNFDEMPTKKEMEEGLEDDIHYYSKGDSMKALKRLFSLLRLEGEKKNKKLLDKLIEFFNSEIGFLNKIKNELTILETLLTFPDKKPDFKDVVANLQFIKEQLASIYKVPFADSVFRQIDAVSSDSVLRTVRTLIHYFREKINKTSKKYLKLYIS
nr:MAG: hypothetical protein [Lake Baikal virophage 8]